MSKKRIVILGKLQKDSACEFIQALPDGRHVVEISEYKERRSVDQNNRMWAMLNDISKQVIWHGSKLTSENWKDIITAAIKRQQVVPGIDGGFVVLGTSTKKMAVSEMCEVIDFMLAFGHEHKVVFKDPSFQFD